MAVGFGRIQGIFLVVLEMVCRRAGAEGKYLRFLPKCQERIQNHRSFNITKEFRQIDPKQTQEILETSLKLSSFQFKPLGNSFLTKLP